VLLSAWLILLAAVFLAPLIFPPANLADNLTRNTVRLALLGYFPALALILLMRPSEFLACGGRGSLARWLWTLGWLTYLVHLAVAFHFYHGWSHARAFQHVRDVSGFGPGIFVSHFFTLVWTADCLWWWISPASYAFRPAWVKWAVQGFMAFITFNAMVVYESGPIAWAGLALFAGLGGVLLYRWRRKDRLA
jgi:LPXTG-motif cell wall-anchored protein